MKTMKEEFNDYLENKIKDYSNLNTNYTNNKFYLKELIENTCTDLFIEYDLNYKIVHTGDLVQKFYTEFGRDTFLILREQFLDYKMKKDLKDKLESKLPQKQVKTGVKKI